MRKKNSFVLIFNWCPLFQRPTVKEKKVGLCYIENPSHIGFGIQIIPLIKLIRMSRNTKIKKKI